ncbi:peptide deformylase [Desulfobaculum bizertense]|uniref:Peptide deformylase n=1 Tax=Desulfobaculum bizertense DSM 18034 TaxID=1121442 RepID=A0A1T4WCQ9_9BACT|nr:peptide deformylase [Desulfobaculum bizertense]UIJ37475.1 peptide deformylase [Desulfobaculum bizertense]SKA74705.1 peptide deformylase [Desulfobaculum bizertense DSM 18034]
MKREIVTYPDPVLAQTAEEITELTPELKQLAEDMVETMYEGDGIGLAAPQVGESCRLVVIDITGPEKREELRILVNPCITSKEGEVDSEEGCLSVVGYRGKVKRAEKVTVDATDLEGKPVHIEADGLLAICLQHELDHLDGVLFIDHLSRLKRNLYDKKVSKWLRRTKKHSK